LAGEEGFAGFLNAIPSAATSPLALVAYVVAAAAWTAIAWRVRRFNILMKYILTLPEADRRPTIEAEFGYIRIPEGITGEQYLRG
jgi:hypothetical protein